METVTRFPTLKWQKLAARLMLTVWGYLTTAEGVLNIVFAMLLCLSLSLVVEAFSTNKVNKGSLYICTIKQLKIGIFSHIAISCF